MIASLDPEEVEAALQRYTTRAADRHRRQAHSRHNRNGDGHFETATLVEHATRMPVATLNYHDDGGEIAAVRTLLEQAPVEGRVITLDALHTTRDTARAIVETHRADYLMSVKDNAPETRKALETVDWERAASGRFEEKIEKAHGRIDNAASMLTPLPRLINYPHVAQIFRSPANAPTQGTMEPGKPASNTLMASPRRRRNAPPRNSSSPGTAATGRSKSIITSATRPSPKTPASPAPVSRPPTMSLHQPRARHHHPQDPVRKLRFRDPALRAAAPGRAHGAAVALNPAFPANPRLPVGEPARAPRSPPPRKSTPFAAALDPANHARESPAAALRGKYR